MQVGFETMHDCDRRGSCAEGGMHLEPDSPFAVVALGEEGSLGHAGLGQVDIHPRPLQTLLQLHCCQLVVQLGIGVCCEVTVVTVLTPAARHTVAGS